MPRTIVIALVATGLLAGNSAKAGAADPDFQRNPYLTYSCKELVLAATQASVRADEDVGIKSDATSKNAAGETTIFWPKAFFANGSGEKATDLSHLKQEMISIEQASVQGQCQIQFDGPRPPGA